MYYIQIMGKQYWMYCYYGDTYINKWKIDKRLTIEDYYDNGNKLIMDGLKKGYSIQHLIKIMNIFLCQIKERRDKKLPVYRSDHLLAVQSLFGLIKLKQYTENDLLLIMKRKSSQIKKLRK